MLVEHHHIPQDLRALVPSVNSSNSSPSFFSQALNSLQLQVISSYWASLWDLKVNYIQTSDTSQMPHLLRM